MPKSSSEPSEQNEYLFRHTARLLDSLRHWTGRDLIEPNLSSREQARALFHAPFVILSHNTDADPILNYANRAGLQLFELSWAELIRLPSRMTTEPIHQEERARLLATVSHQGFIDDYCGVRITKCGRRFVIEQATVWNLFNEGGKAYGQAATFSHWKFLE